MTQLLCFSVDMWTCFKQNADQNSIFPSDHHHVKGASYMDIQVQVPLSSQMTSHPAQPASHVINQHPALHLHVPGTTSHSSSCSGHRRKGCGNGSAN